jgi:DNA-binding beta-propeller fold protein YncE
MSESRGDPAGGWRPRTRLGANAPGALQALRPTAARLSSPRGVHLGTDQGRDVLVVADTGNHRVLIWHDLPTRDEQPCDVVIGQPDEFSDGPAAGSGDTRGGLHLPTGVLVHDGKLVIADAWHHRVLVYDRLPQSPGALPDLVLGQPDLDSAAPNAGGVRGPRTLNWPFGVAVAGAGFYIADTGNRRVLGWSGGLPSSPATPPDIILGAGGCQDGEGGPPGPASFRWPHDVAGIGEALYVADAGNHRVLGWAPRPGTGSRANLVLGQPDLASAAEAPGGAQGAGTLRSPYAADADGSTLAVADTANNRVLLWDSATVAAATVRAGCERGPAATAVLGQPGFGPNGENRWSRVARETLCWPYGLSLSGGRLAVADSGNNRVVIWSQAGS